MRPLLFLLLFVNIAFSEVGSLSGRITDLKNSEVLIGANVVVKGTTLGGATDINGEYFISDIPEGEVDLVVTYIGYKKKEVLGVYIKAGQTIEENILLEADVISIMGVEVQAVKKEGDAASSLAQKQDALEMQDNISSDQISKAGDSNVASAVRRVTGVTIVEDKFLVVRGLGDRYSMAQLNSTGMPSPEPDKRSVPLNLFSTALIKSIDVAKSYRADLPGTFGGGNVNIRTKIYPERTIYRLKIGSSVNTNLLPGDKYRKNLSGSNDYFGFDNGSRNLPSIFDKQIVDLNTVPDDFMQNLMDDSIEVITGFDLVGNDGICDFACDTVMQVDPDSTTLRTNLWKKQAYPNMSKFPKIFTNTLKKAGLPSSFGLTLGTKRDFNSQLEGGFLFDASFSSKYKNLDERFMRWSVRNTSLVDTTKILIPGDIQLDRQLSQYSTNMGMNISGGLTFRKKMKFNLQSIYTHTSNDRFISATGKSLELSEGALLINQKYSEKSILQNSISFLNEFDFLLGPIIAKNNLDVKITSGRSVLYEPYIFSHNYYNDDGSDYYRVYEGVNAANAGDLYSSEGNEKNSSLLFNHLLKTDFVDIKYGMRLDSKERRFDRRYLIMDFSDIETSNDSNYIFINGQGSVGNQFTDQNLTYYDASIDSAYEGYMYFERSSVYDAYDAKETVDAFYLMANTKIKGFQISAGVRSEDYKLNMNPMHPVTDFRPYTTEDVFIDDPVTGFDTSYTDTLLIKFNKSKKSLLPTSTINYDLSEKSKIRSSYSKTLARAQFREYAPYAYQEFFGSDVSIGYPFLKNTDIASFDIRYDYYPKGLELVSIGYFLKTFRNPIEVVLVASSGRSYYKSWQNAERAVTNGVEFEIRKGLPFIPASVGFLNVNSNITISSSEIETSDSVYVYRIQDNNAVGFYNQALSYTKTRPLQGQSDMVFNAGLNFKSSTGYDLNLTYNTYSKRLIALAGGLSGSFWELPFHSLNFTAGKKIGKLKFSFRINNLLDDDVEQVHIFEAPEDKILNANYQGLWDGKKWRDGNNYTTTKYKVGRSFSLSVTYAN